MPSPETVGELGEAALVARVAAVVRAGSAFLAVGPGDDAAVLVAPDGRVVATTDLLVEGEHFRLDWSTPYDVGRKAAAQNLADVAAMGARATGLLVGLAAPASVPVDAAEALAAGLRDECAEAGCAVAGGDVVRGPVLMLGVTALGDLEGRAPVLLSGARPGDVVVVAGALGLAEAGLRMLRAGRDGPAEALAGHRAPRPPYRMGPALAAAGATAMTDTSDGLARDLGAIAAASGVGVELDDLPVPAAVVEAVGPDAPRCALHGGEDHALVATLPPDAEVPAGATVVGRVVAGAGVRLRGVEVPPTGWDAFG